MQNDLTVVLYLPVGNIIIIYQLSAYIIGIVALPGTFINEFRLN